MEILTEKQLGEKLGLSFWTIRRMRITEGLPHFTVGKRIFYNFEHVCQWIEGKETTVAMPSETNTLNSTYGKLRQIN